MTTSSPNPTASPNPAAGPDPGAAELLRRWDAQQGAYVAHREQRFEVMLRTLELLGHRQPVVLDLACGPGSISARVLQCFPAAEVVAVDQDPLLLQLARDTVGRTGRVTVLDADIASSDWTEQLAPWRFDAVLSSTALHWLDPAALVRVYGQLGRLLPPGALVLNADHLRFDPRTQPGLVDTARRDDEATQQQAFATGTPTWDAWWADAESVPAYADLVPARQRVWADKSAPEPVTLEFHLAALRCAGFAEAATIWQYLDDYVIYARRDPQP